MNILNEHFYNITQMKDLVIIYAIPGRYKTTAIISAMFLLVLSVIVALVLTQPQMQTPYLYLGVAGALIAIITILVFTVWSSETRIELNNELMGFKLPGQKINGSLPWENITNIGMGLAHLEIITNANKNFKIDFENLKYGDIKKIKTKLIEISELKGIPFHKV